MREDSKPAKSALEKLLREMQTNDSNSSTLSIDFSESETNGIDQEFQELVEQVTRTLPIDAVSFDETIVKENLEEILLLLIALHGETNGKTILSDVARLFGAQLSPGTVYPSLHDLEEEELLAMHSMVRTKEYSIDDQERARACIERTMVQHLAFGLLFYAFLSRG